MYAHLYGSKAKGWTVTISKKPSLAGRYTPEGEANVVVEKVVAGKREANALAKQHGAKPWNF